MRTRGAKKQLIVLTCLACFGAPGTAEPQWFPEEPDLYPSGDPAGVVAVAAGDVNGDGWPDLVAVNSQSEDISLLLNAGDGTFLPEVRRYPVGQDSQHAAMGDLNGDGLADVVVTNALNQAVSVYLADGRGGLMLSQVVQVSGQAIEVALGDLDGDGDLDAATANQTGGGMVSLLRNEGGVLSHWMDLPHGSRSVCIADVDNDGNLDVVSLGGVLFPNAISIQYGDGRGGFTEIIVIPINGAGPSIAAGDLNNDGLLDIVISTDVSLDVGSQSILGVAVRTQHAPRQFTAPRHFFFGGSWSLHIEDYDDDGCNDVITYNDIEGAIAIYWGDPLGTLSGWEHIAPLFPATGTLVNDGGDLGVLLSKWGETDEGLTDLHPDGVIDGCDLAALLANWGVIEAREPAFAPTGAFQMVVTDLNGDGYADIAAHGFQVQVYLNPLGRSGRRAAGGGGEP